MNVIQKALKDTEKDYYSDSPSATPEALRRQRLEQIELEIESLIRRRKRLERGLDDYMLY